MNAAVTTLSAAEDRAGPAAMCAGTMNSPANVTPVLVTVRGKRMKIDPQRMVSDNNYGQLLS